MNTTTSTRESNIFILARKSINDIRSKINLKEVDDTFSVRVILLSTFVLVLKRYSDEEEFSVQLSNPQREEAEGSDFAADAPVVRLAVHDSAMLKIRIPNDPTFAELANDISRVVKVMFTLDSHFKTLFGSKELRVSLVKEARNKGGIKFLMIPSNEDPIVAKIDYKTDLSDPDLAWMMKQHYLNLLNEIVVDPEKKISKYTILSHEELNRILYEWNQKEAWFPYHHRLIHLFKKSDENLASLQNGAKKAPAKRKIYILDKNMNCMPVGCPGTLYVSREGIPNGSYMIEPMLASKRFIQNPLVPNEILYNTGNVARWLPDGNIDFPEKDDRRGKLKKIGITIEEIERVISAYPQIRECKIAVKEDARHEKSLVAFVVLAHKTKTPLDEIKIKKYLEEQLPIYFIPSEFIIVDTLPENNNNRIEYDN